MSEEKFSSEEMIKKMKWLSEDGLKMVIDEEDVEKIVKRAKEEEKEKWEQQVNKVIELLGNLQVSTKNYEWHIGAMWGLNKGEMFIKEYFRELVEG